MYSVGTVSHLTPVLLRKLKLRDAIDPVTQPGSPTKRKFLFCMSLCVCLSGWLAGRVKGTIKEIKKTNDTLRF